VKYRKTCEIDLFISGGAVQKQKGAGMADIKKCLCIDV